MGSLRLCMAAMVGRVTFLRVVVEAPSGEWEECLMVGCDGLDAACRTAGRFKDLFRATAPAREGAAAAVEKVDGIVVPALDNKARDMFALMLGMRMADCVIFIVDVSNGESGRTARPGMTGPWFLCVGGRCGSTGRGAVHNSTL